MEEKTPIRLSASAVKAFRECEYRYARDYVDRLPQDQREPVPLLAFGNAIHATIADFIRAGGWGKLTHQDLLQLLLRHRKGTVFPDAASDITDFQRAKAMLEAFYFSRYPRDISQELGVEQYVSWRFPRRGIVATGKLDRICRLQDQSIEVIDYKTGKVPTTGLLNDIQGIFYRTLIADRYREQNPPSIRLTYFYLASAERKIVEITRKQFIERWKEVDETANRMRASRHQYEQGLPLWEAFPLRRGGQCKTCSMRTHCGALEIR